MVEVNSDDLLGGVVISLVILKFPRLWLCSTIFGCMGLLNGTEVVEFFYFYFIFSYIYILIPIIDTVVWINTL